MPHVTVKTQQTLKSTFFKLYCLNYDSRIFALVLLLWPAKWKGKKCKTESPNEVYLHTDF